MVLSLNVIASAVLLAQLTPVPAATPALNPAPIPATAIVAPPVPESAPSFSALPSTLPSPDIPGVVAQPFVGIKLEDAVSMALSRNGDLAVSQLNRRVAGYQVVAAKGAYDLRFQVAPTFSSTQSPPESAFEAGPNGGPISQVTLGGNASLSGITPGGGRYSLGLSAQRINNNATVNSFNPFYLTSMGLTFTQPLGQGSGMNQTREQLALAKIGVDQSDAQALQSASSKITEVSSAYDDLLAAWRNVGIQEDALRQAQAQSESNARLVRAGQAAPTDVVESNAQVSLFQNNVYAALQSVGSLQNHLKSLLTTDVQDPIWRANLVPTTLETQLPPEPNLATVVLDAMRNRPEISLLRDQQRSVAVALANASDAAKPQVDIQLGVTENGFAGTAESLSANPIFQIFGSEFSTINQLIAAANAGLPSSQQIAMLPAPTLAVPPYTVGGLNTAISSMFNARYPTYSAGLVIGLPLGNRTAKADVAAVRAQQRQVQIQEASLIQQFTVESRNAVQGYHSAMVRMLAAQAARKAAEDVAASEQRKFKAGASTTYLVLQRQVAVADDRGVELTAQTDLEKAVVELDRVSGQTFERHGINVGTLGTATADQSR
ncbi:MAG TPA: TolC family protein [Candidatus Baltobacteraceae bacterium]|jgi:outer membrane protein TolC|nr:TolC family protein [Candidatus Baltobacteraceae bacterium]